MIGRQEENSVSYSLRNLGSRWTHTSRAVPDLPTGGLFHSMTRGCLLGVCGFPGITCSLLGKCQPQLLAEGAHDHRRLGWGHFLVHLGRTHVGVKLDMMRLHLGMKVASVAPGLCFGHFHREKPAEQHLHPVCGVTGIPSLNFVLPA